MFSPFHPKVNAWQYNPLKATSFAIHTTAHREPDFSFSRPFSASTNCKDPPTFQDHFLHELPPGFGSHDPRSLLPIRVNVEALRPAFQILLCCARATHRLPPAQFLQIWQRYAPGPAPYSHRYPADNVFRRGFSFKDRLGQPTCIEFGQLKLPRISPGMWLYPARY